MHLSIGHGPSCTKFYLVIPETECSQTDLFLISGNDTKFSYDLIKFYSSQEQDLFTGQLELCHFNPFTVIPELTRHALTIVQRDPRVNSGLAICVYSLTVYHE